MEIAIELVLDFTTYNILYGLTLCSSLLKEEKKEHIQHLIVDRRSSIRIISPAMCVIGE